MKHFNSAALKTLAVLMLVFSVNCAKKESTMNGSVQQPIPNDGTPYTPPTNPGPGYNPGTVYGATTTLQVESLDRMGEYTGRPMYDPEQIEINLNLKRYGESYGGTVRISYSDYGQRYQGYFTSGHSAQETKYNIWFRKNGKDIWHGFFEDYLGAIVVVLDGVTSLGDGGSEAFASGSVWFKNFGFTYAPRPPAWCWFVSLGPYDCRAWKSGEVVDTKRAIYPDNGYKKLGSFSDLELEKAFNGDI